VVDGLAFDRAKFGAPAEMISRLHSLGFSVTLWVIPFAEPASAAYADGSALGHWLRGADGAPLLVRWWQGLGAILNVSSTSACEWFESRLRKLMEETGVDGFKFDAGEDQFLPREASGLSHSFATQWARLAARLGDAGEVRAAHRSQDVRLWLREFDKDSSWTAHNGLRSLLTSALHLGTLGYPFVLPDMVGGNGYADDGGVGAASEPKATRSEAASVSSSEGEPPAAECRGDSGASFFYGPRPSRELFIRWCFANALLPALQFSLPPWLYDEEASAACAKALARREARMSQLEALAEVAAATYRPMVAPLWAFDPTDPSCFHIDDQFMLGDSTLVAPVLDEGARARAIYLPAGQWRSERGQLFTGPIWLHAYPVPLDHLAEFDLVSALGAESR